MTAEISAKPEVAYTHFELRTGWGRSLLSIDCLVDSAIMRTCQNIIEQYLTVKMLSNPGQQLKCRHSVVQTEIVLSIAFNGLVNLYFMTYFLGPMSTILSGVL